MNELTLSQLLATTGSPGSGQLSDLFLISRNNIGYAMTISQLLSTMGWGASYTQLDFQINSQNTPTFTAGEEYVLFPETWNGYTEFDLTFSGNYAAGATVYGEITAKFSVDFKSGTYYPNQAIKLISVSQSGSTLTLTQSQLNKLLIFTAYYIPNTININSAPTTGVILTVKINQTIPFTGTTNSLFAHVSSNATQAYSTMTGTSKNAVLGIVGTAYAGQTSQVVPYDIVLSATSLDNQTLILNPVTKLAEVNTENIASYSTGTWSPLIGGNSTVGTYMPTVELATWTKVGNLVTLVCNITGFTAASGGVGSTIIENLPFQPNSIHSCTPIMSTNIMSGLSGIGLVSTSNPNNNYLTLFMQASTGYVSIPVTQITTSSDLYFVLTYTTNS